MAARFHLSLTCESPPSKADSHAFCDGQNSQHQGTSSASALGVQRIEGKRKMQRPLAGRVCPSVAIQPKEGGSQCRPRVPTRRSDRPALVVACYAGDCMYGREVHWDTGARACNPDGTFYLVARRLFLQHDGEGLGSEFNRVLAIWGLPHERLT